MSKYTISSDLAKEHNISESVQTEAQQLLDSTTQSDIKDGTIKLGTDKNYLADALSRQGSSIEEAVNVKNALANINQAQALAAATIGGELMAGDKAVQAVRMDVGLKGFESSVTVQRSRESRNPSNDTVITTVGALSSNIKIKTPGPMSKDAKSFASAAVRSALAD